MPSDDRQPEPRSLGPVVRPYAITGGRVAHRMDLEIEALVSTTPLGEAAPGQSYEWRAIARLCRGLQSIAEVSALLDLPLGVARVLVGDMVAAGLLQVYRPAPLSEQADVVLLERVLEGLRRL